MNLSDQDAADDWMRDLKPDPDQCRWIRIFRLATVLAGVPDIDYGDAQKQFTFG